MPHTHLSQSKSRRDLAASLRGFRPRKRARLRHRRLQAERLEDRQMLATISGAVFNDLNANGLKDGGEAGQSGWTVYLDADGNGQLGTGETTAVTAADGSYSFGGLAAGTYTVAEVQQPGWQQTSPVGSVPSIERVSVANDGTQGNGLAYASSISADGRYVAFSSDANNLVAGDTNGVKDVFLYDRQTDTTERISVKSDGTQGDGQSNAPQISADGSYVTFYSIASNLVPGDTNGKYDAFVYDRGTHTTERVSVASDGMQGDGDSYGADISADGRYVAIVSKASNLVADDTNGTTDVFVVDRLMHSIERVSLASNGIQGNGLSDYPSISADGIHVSFASDANNLVPNDTNRVKDVFVYDRGTRTTERVSVAADGTQGGTYSFQPAISPDGRHVTFNSSSTFVPGDTNGGLDAFVVDRQTHSIERANLASDGTQGTGLMSSASSISADGRYVAICSLDSNLVPGDTNNAQDIFVYDRQTDTIRRVSVAANGAQANTGSMSPALSADGRYVTFWSGASNLVSSDTNGVYDVFVTANPFAPVPGSHVVALADDEVISEIGFGNTSLATKFYVVNDLSVDRTYEYNATGTSVETYYLNAGNTAPRGAASTIAGDKTWVVDANRKVYVYDNSGGLLGSWTAGTLSTTATVEGIATNGTDVWIVDAKSDKVYKYAGAATRLSGSQNAASSFSLNSANTSPKDIVTNGVNLWVVNDSTTDKVFKYTTAGALVSSWTITTVGATSPTGITIDPANVSNIWIVDSGTDRVYQYNAAVNLANGSSKAADVSFALAAGNTNPQGIADPPAPSAELWVMDTLVRSAPVSPTATLSGTDAALESLYSEPLRPVSSTLRVRDNSPLSRARTADGNTREFSYTTGASANRITDDSRSARDNRRHAEVDDLFAQWDSDPLQLFSFPNLGA